MLAEVISIGDELTSGQRLDTNSRWVSEKLGEIGVRVLYHTTVADDLDANVRVFREAIDRADIVVATGGLGPTADDLTRDVLAEVAGQPLQLDERVLAKIRALFARRKRDMPERNIVQAKFPRGARVVPNPHGTAPGIDLDVPRPGRAACRIVALPGVPAELFEMWEQTVGGALAAHAGAGRVIRHFRLKCFGAGESDLEQMLPDLIRRGRDPSVGITVSEATITLRITAAGATAEECRACMQPTIDVIRQCLGTLVFGEEDDELEHAVGRLLAQKKRTLATLELGTHGLMAHWLGEAPTPEGVFKGGLAARDWRQAERCLDAGASGLPAEAADGQGVEQALLGLAGRLRETFSADFALATGPFPEFRPNAVEPEQSWFALQGPHGSSAIRFPFAGHPAILKPRAAKQALNLLRLSLLEDPGR